MKRTPPILLLLCLAGPMPAEPAKRATSDLDYWLGQAQTAPASQPAAAAGVNPFEARTADGLERHDALPSAVRLSDGTLLAGGIFTTEGKDYQVWIESEQRWRHLPLVCIRGIHAEVAAEAMEDEWRWKEMGADERVKTGRQFPTRRLQWRFNLIDGTTMLGEVKGQPLWIERDGKRTLLVLHARMKGQPGQTLADLVYPKDILVSRRAMEQAATRPAR